MSGIKDYNDWLKKNTDRLWKEFQCQDWVQESIMEKIINDFGVFCESEHFKEMFLDEPKVKYCTIIPHKREMC